MADDDESLENRSILGALTMWEKLNFIVLIISIIAALLIGRFFGLDYRYKADLPTPVSAAMNLFTATVFLIIIGSYIRNIAVIISNWGIKQYPMLLGVFRVIWIFIMPVGTVAGLASD